MSSPSSYRSSAMLSRCTYRGDAKTVLTGIGTETKRPRQKLGISQDMLATKAGVHRNVIGLAERGTGKPLLM
jgi:DNA-binding XRE family transcriptional regulator